MRTNCQRSAGRAILALIAPMVLFACPAAWGWWDTQIMALKEVPKSA